MNPNKDRSFLITVLDAPTHCIPNLNATSENMSEFMRRTLSKQPTYNASFQKKNNSKQNKNYSDIDLNLNDLFNISKKTYSYKYHGFIQILIHEGIFFTSYL